jgi:non-specific serine/threonine protein kinase
MRVNTVPSNYALIYNLKEYAKGIYLPSSFIVNKNQKGALLYIQKKSSPTTIAAFKIALSPADRQLFQIIDKLQVKTLEKKFNPPRKKAKPLIELINQDRLLEKSITNYIHRELDAFLKIIIKNNFTLCWDILRKVLVKDVALAIAKEPLTPHLFFKKTATNVLYKLSLSDKKETWQINQKDIIPITNASAWVFIDYQLHQIPHINGFMLKPFLKKQEVIIPNQHVKTYFQSFILKIASEVDMTTEGFQVIDDNRVLFCQLELIKNVFNNEFGIKVSFAYTGVTFLWNDKTSRKSGLKFNEEEIVITRVNRHFPTEKKWIHQLKSLGLTNANNSYFGLPDAQKSNSLFNWFVQHLTPLQKAGFKVIKPTMEGKTIALAIPKISFNDTQAVNDWFDINGLVEVGKFKIPFKKIATFIKKGNAYYPLPDGTFFLIPEEWFTRFKGLLQFARFKNDQLQLAKSQYTLLNELNINIGEALEKDYFEFDYQPSKALKATLRPYQLEGVKWLLSHYQNELGACLADDMGLGKTLQTIAVLLYAKEQMAVKKEATLPPATPQLDLFQAAAYPTEIYQALKAIIILPASLVFNWEKEIRKFAPSLLCYKHLGPKRHDKPKLIGSFDIILTTYHTALRDIDTLKEVNFEYIILDESQQIKNKDSKIFKAINQLNGHHKISLSGTPIENSLADLWAQMQFINPNTLGSFRFFKDEFIRPIEKLNEEDKKVQLQKLIQPYLLRRTKEAVATDLPELSTKVFYTVMSPEQKKLYEKEKSAARNFLLKNFENNDGKYQFMVLQSLTKLRQLANHPVLAMDTYQEDAGKFKDIIEHLEVIHKGGHKTLLFSSFVKHLDLFKSYFEKHKKGFSRLTGKLSQKERKKQIEQFENNPTIQSFLISIKAGGTGLNLTAADYVFILDPWWNPFIEKQAIARAHRIGQTKNVFAIKFITKDSIEEKILKLQEKKARLAEQIIEGKGSLSFSKEDIRFLLS